MIRRIFTSSATEDDVIEVMDEYEKNSKRYSTESEEGVSETRRNESANTNQQDVSTPTSDSSSITDHQYSPNSYFDIFTKMSKSKKHTNKISAICIDNRHKNNTIYTSGMDGISCRWMINNSKNRSSVQIDLPSSSLTSNSSLPEIEDFSKSIQLDFMYEKLPSVIITQHLFNEFLFVSTDDMMLTLFYIHNEKAMCKIKCNQVVTCIFAFECPNAIASNDLSIAGNVCVGLRNGEFNMYTIQKQYSKLGKWVGTILVPNDTFNRNYTPRHFRQINYIGLVNTKELLESYELNKSAAHTNNLLLISSSSSVATSTGIGSSAALSSQSSNSAMSSTSTNSSGSGTQQSTVGTSSGQPGSPIVEIDYTKVNYHIKDLVNDQILLVTASNDCFVKIWTPSGGELVFIKEFDSPCTKVASTSFRKDNIRTRFFFVSHSNDVSIFSLTGKSKHPADFRVHFNINQFFLHQVPESFDQNLNSSSNLSGKSPAKSRRDRGYSTALSAKESNNIPSQGSQGRSTKCAEVPVSKNGYIYLIGWNSMQARMEVWLYNLHDQKTKPVSQYQQKILGVTFLQNLVLDRTQSNQFGTDLITTFTVMYSCYKKLYIKNLILRKSLLESSKKPLLVLPILSSTISEPSPPIEVPLPQKYCNSHFSDLYYTITTKKALEMRNPVKIAQIIQNHFKELSEIDSMEAKINFIQQVYSNSSKTPEMRFNFVLNISHYITCQNLELTSKSKQALEHLNQEVLQSRKGISLHKKFMYIREISLKLGEAKLTVLNYDTYIQLLADFCKPDSIERLRNIQVSSSSSRRIAVHIQDLFKVFFRTLKTTKNTYKLHPKTFDSLPNPNLLVERVECKSIEEVYRGLGRLLAFIMIQPYLFIEDFFPSHAILKTILGLPILFTDFSDFGNQYLALKHVVEKRQDGSKKLSELIPSEVLDDLHLSHDEDLAKIMATNVSEENKIQLIKQAVCRLMFSNISMELENILFGVYEFLPSLDCVRALLDELELNSLFVGTKVLHNDYVLYKKPSSGKEDLLSLHQMMDNDPMVAWLWEFIYDDMDAAIVADNLRSCWISKKCLPLKNDLMYYNPIPIISRDENLDNDVIFRPEEQEICIGSFKDKENFFACLLHHIEQNAGRRSTITGHSPLPLTPRQAHNDSIFDQSTYSSSLSSYSTSPLLKTM